MRVSLPGIVQAAAFVTAVFSILTLLPVDNFGIQLFTHFRLQYLVLSLLFLVAYRLLRSPWIIGAVTASAVISAFCVLPWYFGSQGTAGATELKLLHANVLSHNTQYEKLLKLVEDEQPDIIVLQEVSPQWAAALQPMKATYPYGQIEAREGNFGIALLSRFPLGESVTIESPPLAFPTIVADVLIDERSVHLVTTHPMIPAGRHLYSARNEQLDTLPKLLESDSDASLLVGDLNAGMWDYHYRKLEDSTGLRNARKGFGVVPTWPTFMPFAMIPIDHVLVSDAISVQSIHSGSRIGSDHLPLIVTMSL